jgi:DNA-binding transcriptional LysR family regulator
MNLEQLARYDIKLLVALQVLIEEGNVTRAAERLFVTQSAMSKMLARLKETFGEELFIRTSHGIQPTDRALALKLLLNNALDALGVLLTSAVFKAKDCTRTFRISMIENMAIRVVPNLLSTLSKLAPGVRIQLKSWSKSSFDDLAAGQLDLAINVVDIERANFYQQKLADIKVCAVVRKDHPLSRKKEITLDDFLSFPFIKVVIPEFNENKNQDSNILAALGKVRNVAFETENGQLALECVSKTDYVMLGVKGAKNPDHQRLGLTTIDVPKELSVPTFTMKISWHQRQHLPPEHVWFRKLLLTELMSLAK